MKFIESKKLFFSSVLSLGLLLFVLLHLAVFRTPEGFSTVLFAGSVCMVPAIWALLSFQLEIPEKARNIAGSLLFGVIPFFNLFFACFLEGGGLGDGATYLLNLLIYIMIQLFLFALSGSMRWSGLLSVVVIIGYNSINHLITFFRGTPIVPGDFLSIKTAIHVAGNYQYQINSETLFTLLASALFLILFWRFSFDFKRKKTAIIGVCSSVVAFVVIGGGLWNADVRALSNVEGRRGVALDLYLNFRKMKLKEPEGYDKEKAEQILNAYPPPTVEANTYPNVIAIMNESFSDLSVVGEFETNEEYLSFFKGLQENAVRGQLLVSPFGGNTCNTEFEFLTGLSVGLLPQGSIPYLQYIKAPVDSLAEYFLNLGYQTVAFHPYYKTCWNREEVYKLFGFEEFISQESMSALLPENQQKQIRNYLSDASDYEMIIRRFEQKPEEERLFLFNVTIQNHGGYEYEGEDFAPQIQLADTPGKWQQTEQYLSLVKQSDTALKGLISYFEKVNEPTVIVFFGDHQPGIEKEFYEQLYGKKLEELTQQELLKRYKIPFMIWANYDIEEKDAGLISPNYLSQLLLETAGLPQEKLHTFLKAVLEEYPSINAMGFYDKAGGWHPRENGFPALLKDYDTYEYYSIFSR
jgi:hypothetical protein